MDELSFPVQKIGEKFSEPGLYLFLPDDSVFELTKKNIDRVTEEFWSDPNKISDEVKEAIAFQRCSICPLREEEGICNSLKPILPLLEKIDKYKSYEKIIAVYKTPGKKLYSFNETDMQGGLLFVTTFSLINYCLLGQKYSQYYKGINPLDTMLEFGSKIFLNIFWEKDGVKETVDETITQMSEEVSIIVKCLLDRLRLLCHNDAFLNAFVGAQVIVEYLDMEKDKILDGSENSFALFNKEIQLV